MSRNLLIYLNISLIALVLWLLLKPQPVPVATDDINPVQASPEIKISQLERRIETLQQDLDREIAARINLEQRLQNQPAEVVKGSPPRENESPAQRITDVNQTDEFAPVEDQQAEVEGQLIAAGMPIETIRAMNQTVDRNRLEMLQLRDRAIREGWDDSDEYREQMRELRNPYRALREDFGNEAFDQFLYASGIPNRVRIQEVYSGSAADNAGLVPGDIIVSYADNRIYSMTTLRDSTLEGFAGENILLEVVRDGEQITASLPRGPLGISMSSLVIKPDSM